jgi:hypothetical protein
MGYEVRVIFLTETTDTGFRVVHRFELVLDIAIAGLRGSGVLPCA